ncbi:5-methyltetrahydropteroyltriglutamate--homocysteine S-methyltransferase [Buchnera aphidicola]|uniref:5-methyltetrahydropteroyltriglutamate--homocysteine methyltransferase n=1 Tax=Buchnera aphidicola (Stegophylla sp.) TaxID=2315800 RepID=A0A4D6Y8G6_9GAMM|nr:5-methyltetrahydropteroyltriglutamate--homocysteine S-methyltransferase [Buchnera aphidicola (Stegophylla sp.)]QCI26226.1 5-methyltetrahydropteroyltriglutamate--homocysteine S-methyltransferase [Buchnera aphidicola (Stegophylla sp.)]
MTIVNHTLGFPRIGINRELKIAQENYWSGKISQQNLLETGYKLRSENWKKQQELGINFIPVGDFSWYDHVLTTSMMLGNVPLRHQNHDGSINLDTLFYTARGVTPNKPSVLASSMMKWFNTNYHYIVPEFIKNQNFKLSWSQLFDEIDEALKQGYKIKPIILGPLTYLWLGKIKGAKFNKLELLENLLNVYQEILIKIKLRNIEWVQIDEPILSLELPQQWIKSFKITYLLLTGHVKLLLTTYFGSIYHNFDTVIQLPIQGLHIDLVDGKYNLNQINKMVPNDWILSLGVINGRNIWKSDLLYWFHIIQSIIKYRTNLWIGSSCSLLHSPIDLDIENAIDTKIKQWFSFAYQKCIELNLLTIALNNNDTDKIKSWSNKLYTHKYSEQVNNYHIQERINNIITSDFKRQSPYSIRSIKQKKKFNFPILPTTTIGSFPQTNDIRKLRLQYKNNNINFQDYQKKINQHIQYNIQQQELLGIDVLVHGEPERNDMVEYFGEHLNGFIFTSFGWVQSYGSRCVKPPIIIGDIYRSKPITLNWTKYAQSITKKPVKAMLTGPITILSWSFIREDISKKNIAYQIALSLQDEVLDLEASGISIIQIDEPALREGLPLRQSKWKKYLSWATKSFRLSSSQVQDTTQIHTHMCYSEFNDIMNAIVELDADVITIETARSDMELLEFFKTFQYPNEIGPGVYDIHSPNIPKIHNIEKLLIKAMRYIPVQRLWVNPDCGLKTRTWKETKYALKNMMIATQNIRSHIKK